MKLQGHGRWLLISLFLLISSSINLVTAPKTHAIDILQPVTSILNSLLSKKNQDINPSSSSNPGASQVNAAPASQSVSTPPSSSAPSASSAESPEQIETLSSSESGYQALEPDLKPVVLGENTTLPNSDVKAATSTPPTSMAQSVAAVEESSLLPVSCARFFGTCWYWWASALPLAIASSYLWVWVRGRKTLS